MPELDDDIIELEATEGRTFPRVALLVACLVVAGALIATGFGLLALEAGLIVGGVELAVLAIVGLADLGDT